LILSKTIRDIPARSCYRARIAYAKRLGQGSVAGGRVIRGFEDQDVLFKRPKIIAFANTRVQTQSRQRARHSDERTPARVFGFLDRK